MCNTCNSSVFSRSSCGCGCNSCNGNTWNNNGCGCNCGCNNGFWDFWNSGRQFICRDCNGNVWVNRNNNCGCNNHCGCNNGCGCNDTSSNVFVVTCRNTSLGTTTTANSDDYYARLYGLRNNGGRGRSRCGCSCGDNDE